MTKPNLVFIMPDQLRPDFLSCYGARFIETPHIDSLAERGIRFTRAYSTSPLCVPARASLLTGMNAICNGVTDNGGWLRPDLGAMGVRTWPELLSEAGYATAAIGKMHFYPWDITHGFQYRVAAEDKRWIHVRDDYYHFLRARGYRKLHGNEHEGYHEHKGAVASPIPYDCSYDAFTGQEACRFIRTYGGERPFAMMVGFPGPHCPYDPTPEYFQNFQPEEMPDSIPVSGAAPQLVENNVQGNRGSWNGVDYGEFREAHKKKIRAHYAALVKQIDDQVGEIVETLRQQDLLENTVIIFGSDHGDYLGDHGMVGKGTFYEASIHVPLIVCGPGFDAGQTSDSLVALGDVTATLLYLGGVDRPGYMDSRPLPGPGAQAAPRDYLVGMLSSGWMLYDGRWKLCKYATGDLLLFDLETDPAEQCNLAADPAYAERYQRMDAHLTQAILASLQRSHDDRRVYGSASLSSDPSFGVRGWQRNYPQQIGAF